VWSWATCRVVKFNYGIHGSSAFDHFPPSILQGPVQTLIDFTEYRTMLARHTQPHLSAPAVADLAHSLKEN
jgi:hypothetical protein